MNNRRRISSLLIIINLAISFFLALVYINKAYNNSKSIILSIFSYCLLFLSTITIIIYIIIFIKAYLNKFIKDFSILCFIGDLNIGLILLLSFSMYFLDLEPIIYSLLFFFIILTSVTLIFDCTIYSYKNPKKNKELIESLLILYKQNLISEEELEKRMKEVNEKY